MIPIIALGVINERFDFEISRLLTFCSDRFEVDCG